MQVSVEHVIKRFKDHTVLNDINVSFESGFIHGIIGRNGSGKTVLFKCITDLMRPTSGIIRLDGKTPEQAIRSGLRIGAVIDSPEFLMEYSGYTNLSLLAALRGIASKTDIMKAMQLVGLDPKMRKHVGKYSMGMRQRLGIAQAIMENPELLILDEPMNGLDRTGVEEMRCLFRRLADEGRLMLLASHNREDIEALCDDVYEIDAGVLTKVFDRRYDV